MELKRKAPNAQTFLQVVKVRYGTFAHIVFCCYCLVYQFIGTVNLLVGGSAVYAAMTNVNRDAACFLFPIGVIIYTLAGGIKATFITDWVEFRACPGWAGCIMLTETCRCIRLLSIS